MFDRVQFEEPCPHCGKVLTDWQSKSGECFMLWVKPWQVDNFYTSCDCGTWVEYTRPVPTVVEEPPGWKEEFVKQVKKEAA